jgi:DNA-binding GntR family transcriptional regulator
MKAATQPPGAPRHIATIDDINRLRAVLRKCPRDLLFFELAIRTGLHAKDLLNLSVADLRGLKPGQELKLRRIPKISNRIVITPSIQRLFAGYVERLKLSDGDYLFRSNKGGGPLTLVSLSRLVSRWFKTAGLTGLSGALTLRRTWAHHFGSGRHKAEVSRPSNRRRDPHPELSVSLRDSVFRELQKEIVSGKIIPGQRLFIETVSRRTGVSAIPVREALAMLAAGGFVHSDRKRGYLVNGLSAASLFELLELRLLLECKAGEQAALRRREDAMQRLEDHHRLYVTARRANDSEALLRTNREFHNAIYVEADMPILKSHIDQAWDRVSPYYHIMFRQVEKPNPVVGIHHHQRMIEAIRDRKPKDVRRWIKADLTDSTRFVIELFGIHKKLLEHQ